MPPLKHFMEQPAFASRKTFYRQDGYVLLVLILVIGAVGVSIATSLVLLGVNASRNGALLQASIEARALANACAERALQDIWENTAFVGTGNLTFGNGTCTYTVVNTGGENRTVTALGTRGAVARHVTIAVNQVNTTVGVSSWGETPN